MPERGKRHAAEALPAFYAEFGSSDGAVAAARALVARGHTLLDAFTPRPIAALEEVVAPGRSNLNRTVFIWGLIGGLTGLGIEWGCNAWDYPLNVGGRPPFALPAYIPITFEATVLFAAFAAFFGFMHRAGLPWLSHPSFDVPGFERASIDRFFLLVERPLGGEGDALQTSLFELGALNVVATPPAGKRVAEPDPAPTAPPRAEPAE